MLESCPLSVYCGRNSCPLSVYTDRESEEERFDGKEEEREEERVVDG